MSDRAKTDRATSIARVFEVPPQLVGGDPRQCRVYALGFIVAMRWDPRLGEGIGERRGRHRRWTFELGREWVGFHLPKATSRS